MRKCVLYPFTRDCFFIFLLSATPSIADSTDQAARGPGEETKPFLTCLVPLEPDIKLKLFRLGTNGSGTGYRLELHDKGVRSKSSFVEGDSTAQTAYGLSFVFAEANGHVSDHFFHGPGYQQHCFRFVKRGGAETAEFEFVAELTDGASRTLQKMGRLYYAEPGGRPMDSNLLCE